MGTDMQSVIKMIDLLQRLSYEEEERGDKLEERLNKLETAFKTQLNQKSGDITRVEVEKLIDDRLAKQG